MKRVISSILLSAPNGRTQKQLLDDYKKIIGTDVPYRAHGYKTLLACLQDMHDSVRIERNGLDCLLFGVGNESTKYIQKLISRQKSYPSRARPKESAVPDRFKAQLRELLSSYPDGLRCDRFSEAYVKRFGCYANYRSWGFDSIDHVLRSVPDVVILQRDNARNAFFILLNKQLPMTPSVSKSSGAQAKQAVSSLNSLELTSDDVRTTKTEPIIENRVKELLADKCAGIWVSKFAAEYKMRFGVDFPYKNDVIGLLSTLKVCELQSDPTTSDWLVFSSERKRTPVETAELGVPEDLSVAIATMVANYPEGITLDKFKQIYKEEHKREVPFSQHGFYSVAELLVHVPGIRVEKPANSTEVMVLPVQEQKCAAKPNEVERGHPSEKPKVPKAMLDHSCMRYAVQPQPSEKTCPVYVSYVKSPSCLYVQVIGETTTKALESLSEEMSQFYSSKDGGKYSIECVEIGQACCTVYSEDCYWYRAEVVDIPDPDAVKVKYVDYGNIGLVPKVTLRRPKAHYMLLPAQALRCRLANIKPPSEKWCERASLLLGTMTKDRPLVATITSVKNNTLSIYLCDTNTDKDVHISDRLVDQGLAIIAMDTQEDEAAFDGIHLEPPPAATSEDVTKIRPPSSEALVQLGQLAHKQLPLPSLNATVTVSTNAPASSQSPALSPSVMPLATTSDCSVDSVYNEPVPNGGTSSINNNDECSSKCTQTGAHKFVRRVQLTPMHTIHVLNHCHKALVLSHEVSSWFWESDKLKSMLQQSWSSKQIWAQVLTKGCAPELFKELADMEHFKNNTGTSLITYCLDDLPIIVQTFGAAEELLMSIKRELSKWKSSPSTYFSCAEPEKELSLLEAKLKDLHIQRYACERVCMG